MPGPMENRAAVFTSSPQDVEIYRDGSWRPGSLLGWRHDTDGGCQAWVRTSAGGVDDTVWLALDYLRLPEPELAPNVVRRAPSAMVSRDSVDAALTGTIAALRAVPAPTRPAVRRQPSALTTTMDLFAVRDSAVESAPRSTASSAEVSASDVPATTPRAARTGGRRRAPETAEIQVPVAAHGPSVEPGRHRAPAATAGAAGAAGRHRASDTGVWAAVPAAPSAPRPSSEPVRTTSAGPRDEESDAHLYTRPMRLGDLVGGSGTGGVPQPRRASAPVGRLSGV